MDAWNIKYVCICITCNVVHVHNPKIDRLKLKTSSSEIPLQTEWCLFLCIVTQEITDSHSIGRHKSSRKMGNFSYLLKITFHYKITVLEWEKQRKGLQVKHFSIPVGCVHWTGSQVKRRPSRRNVVEVLIFIFYLLNPTSLSSRSCFPNGRAFWLRGHRFVYVAHDVMERVSKQHW